ncbi:MAG: hypothetical protein GWN85_41965 [Gemmatimonadetes bacterium]|nr:hypothetical protein [Gemmatimonadota bacterium]
MGLLRSLWTLTTVVVAGPAAGLGLLTVLEGNYAAGALFIGLAVAFAGVSEYAYIRLTGGTVGRLRGLVPGRGGKE